MSLASHRDLPPIFHVHPEIKDNSGGATSIDLNEVGDRTFFGCEVETNTYYDGYPATIAKKTGWLPAADGSTRGAEWKSPLILPQDEIHPEIRDIIDSADYDRRCGGHIHVVRSDWGGLDIDTAWDCMVDNWSWLFAVLYPERTTNYYSYMSDLSRRRDGLRVNGRDRYLRNTKYNWLHLCDNRRIEFRIFPAVGSVLRLKNRMFLLDNLLKVFSKAQNPEDAFTITMDSLVPAMQGLGGMKNFPRKSMIFNAKNNLGNYIYWPSNLTHHRRQPKPAIWLQPPVVPQDPNQLELDLKPTGRKRDALGRFASSKKLVKYQEGWGPCGDPDCDLCMMNRI